MEKTTITALTSDCVVGSYSITNYEAVKAETKALLAQYDSMVVTEDNLAEAKEMRATLNKTVKIFGDSRKSAEKRVLEAFAIAKGQFKEIEGIIGESSASLDAKIKGVESLKTARKKAAILDLWDSLDHGEVLLASVYDERWENATFSMAKVKEAMGQAIARAMDDLAVLAGMGLRGRIAKGIYLGGDSLRESLGQADGVMGLISASSEGNAKATFTVTGSEESILELKEILKLLNLRITKGE